MRRAFRAAFERKRQHPRINRQQIIVATGSAQAREHDVLVRVEIDPEARCDAGVEAGLTECLVQPHWIAKISFFPKSVRPDRPIR